MPEVLDDDDDFCPLAIDVIQVMDGPLADVRFLLGDDGAGSHEVAAHLERFLLRYRKALGKLAQRKDECASAWMKAHSACEEQLGKYIASQAGSRLAATQRGRRSCEAILGALRALAFSALTRPIHAQLKVYSRRPWTPGWSDISAADVRSIKRGVEEELASAHRRRAPLAWLQKREPWDWCHLIAFAFLAAQNACERPTDAWCRSSELGGT